MISFQTSTWADIEALREQIRDHETDCVEESAQGLTAALASSCPTVVLARVFVVRTFSSLPEPERRFARALVADDGRLIDRTPVLSLLGTSGRDPRWGDRTKSAGHLAIPLLDAAFVQGIPMIAKLLSDMDVKVHGLDQAKTLDTRPLLGGKNAAFYVADARSTDDVAGRRVIPNKEFVEAHGVRTVFGMGGAYLDGTLAVAVVFTSETIARPIVDRFPSLISNFKMATSDLLLAGKVYRASGPR